MSSVHGRVADAPRKPRLAEPGLESESGVGGWIPGRDRLPSLTGLRFWAALLVVLYHLTRQVGPVPGVSPLVMYGRTGVTFFFVLSGFVLAWTYDGAAVSARTFFWRRFARIWPVHAATTALSVAVSLAVGVAVSAKAVGWSVVLLHAWSRQTVRGGNPAAWSLSDEAWFYLTFPVLLAVLAAWRRRGYAMVAVAAFATNVLLWLASSQIGDRGTRLWLLDYFPPTRWLQFLLGVAAGLAIKRGWRSPVPLWLAGVLVVGGHLALLPWRAAVPDFAWYSAYSGSEILSAPLFALLVVAAAQRDLAPRGRRVLLCSPVIVRLGHWSYAWYLLHEIGIRVWGAVVGRPDPGWQVVWAWLVVGLVTQAAAGLLYTVLERPAERWLRRRLTAG